MALFILDEWLWADVAGDNGAARQRETIEVTLAIYDICDRIVMVRGSAFERKAISCWSRTDRPRWQFAKMFTNNFLYNSKKAEFIDASELRSLPATLQNDVQPEDQYLVQAHLACSDSIIITTDGGLKTALDRQGIPCKHRDEFINQYLSERRKS